MLKVALFGTSADPPTAGHQAILKWLSQHYDWVAVWASDNPFKTHQTPLEHRSAMLQLLISDIEAPRNNINLHPELSSPRSLETLEKARAAWGDFVELTLVIGADLVSQMPRWYRVEELLQQVQLLVVPRPGYAIDEAGIEALRRLEAKIEIADLSAPAVSSTAYREKGDAEVLTPPVEDYIHREHLYAWQDAASVRIIHSH